MKKTQRLSTLIGGGIWLLLAGVAMLAADPDATRSGGAAAPAEPAIAKQNAVNVRGQASLNSEVVARLKKGQVVMVLGEVHAKKAKADEPTDWYRIALPTNATVWVQGDFIDKTSKAVRPKLLNLRGGPGENYSVLGRIDKGSVVTVIEEKGPWLRIEPPPAACGFVAAHLLQKGEAAIAAAAPVAPVVPAVPVKEAAATNVVAAPVVTTEVKTNEPAPAMVTTTAVTNVVPAVATNEPVALTNAAVATAVDTNLPAATTNAAVAATVPAVTAPLVNLSATDTNQAPVPPPELIKRVITHEGILKGTFSVQAPSHFELRSVDNNRLIDYVWSPSTNIDLKTYKGKRVYVTGEELLDERWPHTPVISVEEIAVAQ